MSNVEEIKEYIKTWDLVDGAKPSNDPKFITLFTDFARSQDADCWEFSGENHYCGFTATVYEYDPCLPGSNLGFEFAYRNGYVKVFTANHQGYWRPEYIILEGDEANELLGIIKEKLNEWAGF